MLVLLLGATTHRTTNKGLKKWAEESAAKVLEATDASGHGERAMAAVLGRRDEEEEEMMHEALLDSNMAPLPHTARRATAGAGAGANDMELLPHAPDAAAAAGKKKTKKGAGAGAGDKPFPDLLQDAESAASARPALSAANMCDPELDTIGMSVAQVLDLEGGGVLPATTPEAIRAQALAQLYITERKVCSYTRAYPHLHIHTQTHTYPLFRLVFFFLF